MKFRVGYVKASLIGLILAALSVNAYAENWTKVKSANFDLVGNASESDIRDVATRLEQFRVVFGQIFSGLKLNSPVPTTVVVFKDEASFAPYRSNKWDAGYFLSAEDKNYIVLPVGEDRSDTYSTIFHEYIHFLIVNNFGREKLSPWFNEGIAEYYDKFQIRDSQTFTLGGISKRHLETLKRSPIIPLKKFFKIDNEALRNQGGHGASVFYAQSWAFIHFLIRGSNGKRAEQFNRFMNLTLNQEPADSAFQKAFKTDYTFLENEFRSYIAQPHLMTHSILRLDKPLEVDKNLSAKSIGSAESRAYMGDLLYRNGKRNEAEVLLKSALALDSRSGLANSTLGLIRIHQNRLDAAIPFLQKAVESNPNDYSVYYYYGYALGRREGYSKSIAEKIKKAVKRSIRLNPDFAPNYDLIATVSLEMNADIEEGINFARKGLSLSPGDQGFALNLANLYLRNEDVGNAVPLVRRVLAAPSDAEIRDYATKLNAGIRELKKKLGAEGKYAVAENGRPPVRLARKKGHPSGLTKEEYERKQRQVEIRGINSALKKPLPTERRVLAYLAQIKCKSDLVTYVIRSPKGQFSIESKGFKSITFNTYNVNTKDLQIGCGRVKKPVFGVITYRPETRTSGARGIMVRIEFVPEYFTLMSK